IRPGTILSLNDLEGLEDVATRQQLSHFLLDTAFHADDEAWLTELGIGETPPSKWSNSYISYDDTKAAAWFKEWKQDRTRAYHAFLHYKPDYTLLGPGDVRMPAGWPLLLYAPATSRARITAHFLNLLAETTPSVFAPV